MTCLAKTVLLQIILFFHFCHCTRSCYSEMSHVEKMSILQTKAVTKLARQAFSCLDFQNIVHNSKSKGGGHWCFSKIILGGGVNDIGNNSKGGSSFVLLYFYQQFFIISCFILFSFPPNLPFLSVSVVGSGTNILREWKETNVISFFSQGFLFSFLLDV